jgi:hypothetical protein
VLCVGGKSANILSATAANFHAVYFPYGYPYPAVDVKVALPPGTRDEDIEVTTAAGSATLTKAIHYVQGATDYRSPNVFQSILLDRKRNQLYLSGRSHRRLFFDNPAVPCSLHPAVS